MTPRMSLGPYTPELWVLVWLVSGHGAIVSGGRTWPLQPGSVHLAPPGTPFRAHWDVENTAREGNIQFRMDASPTDWPRFRTFPPHHIVPGLLNHILWLSGERPDGWREAREDALRYALRAFAWGYTGVDPLDSVPLSEPVARAVALVQRGWNKLPLTVHTLEELATAGGVTKSYLCRLFERETGMGPVGAFRWLRIERAAALLRETSQPAVSVARLMGFSSGLHFSRLFRAATGLAPGAFRADRHVTFELPPGLRGLSHRLWRGIRDEARSAGRHGRFADGRVI